MLSKIPFYPFLFVTHWVFFLFVYNAHESIPFQHILLPWAIVLSSTGLFFLILSIFRKKLGWAKIGLLTFLFAIVLFIKPHLYTLVELKIPIWDKIPDRILIVCVYLLLFLLGIIILFKHVSENTTRFFNLFSVALLILLYFQYLEKKNGNTSSIGFNLTTTKRFEKVTIPQKPNLYYLILDSYPREDILRDLYQYDNSDFIHFLQDKKFFVADSAKSNYMLTYLSLSSSLNQMYLDTVVVNLGVNSIERAPIYDIGTNNLTVLTLKKQGYQYYHCSSGWGYTNSNPHADKQFYSSFMNEFNELFYKNTIFSHLESKINLSRVSSQHRFNRNIDSIIANVQQNKSPLFVFAHFFPPHPPYIFDENGNLPKFTTSLLASKGHSNRRLFVQQLKYVNRKIKELIENICKYDPQAIILLQADHGMNSTKQMDDEKVISDSLMFERSAILLAFRIPHLKDSTVLRHHLTPVNLFRIVFNELGFPKQELLPDVSYFSTYDKPYRFRIVEF
ncbi:MAG: hypothetical protein N2450_06740 [bacterium]|nr:hypothetical protein [bacterium]